MRAVVSVGGERIKEEGLNESTNRQQRRQGMKKEKRKGLKKKREAITRKAVVLCKKNAPVCKMRDNEDGEDEDRWETIEGRKSKRAETGKRKRENIVVMLMRADC